MLRVLVTRRWPEAVEAALAEEFDVTLNASDTPLTQTELARAIAGYDVLCPTVSDCVDAEVLCGGDRVKLIANYGVGFDHIDCAAARAAGIAVTSTPGVLTDATADLAITLMLMATRRASEGERELRRGDWSGWRPTHMIGTGLQDKVMGIVGFGRIGQAVARRAKHGFGMQIAYHSSSEKAEAEEVGARYFDDLHALLANSDIVSLHVPGGAATEHLMGAEAIAAMRPGSYLINTARGSVLDHTALADALRSGHLAGAGLDVYPDEPDVPPALLEVDSAVLLPHLGSATREARVAMGMRALENIRAFANGHNLPDRVA
ncbi:2-hydroxyacid dehydrogenase [Aurantiacibacter sp. MUD61]|uniref:2-hydroxyacid dehydrogenase n=1 Tax=Aurantiacibacter sp. MUD61 TaxID=3009083 RepID=UPI0022F046A7|nr:D-glycerate dehydrogenase [Aurantiacibacter sp. MUD61]